MAELIEIKEATDVFQTILVVDAMTGQDAVNVASSFNEKVGIDGVILTKLDGDTRGGAALSIKAVTGKPILYVGMGEKLSDLEQFYPDRMASRILGMGDVLTLIEKAEAQLDADKAKAMEEKFKKAEFDFNDFLEYMGQIKNMGGISSIMSMMPGLSAQYTDVKKSIFENGVFTETLSTILTAAIPIAILAAIYLLITRVGRKSRAKLSSEEAELRARYKQEHNKK